MDSQKIIVRLKTNSFLLPFLQQGRRSTEAFLRYFVVQNNLQVKEGYKPDFPPSRTTSTADSGFSKENNNIEQEPVKTPKTPSESELFSNKDSEIQTNALINGVNNDIQDQNGDVPGGSIVTEKDVNTNLSIADVQTKEDVSEL